uniref:Secreted protein n=1 Tax=Ixodes ricinus TaxID=34613 RepID=A0A6B0ULP4_IXORI
MLPVIGSSFLAAASLLLWDFSKALVRGGRWVGLAMLASRTSRDRSCSRVASSWRNLERWLLSASVLDLSELMKASRESSASASASFAACLLLSSLACTLATSSSTALSFSTRVS